MTKALQIPCIVDGRTLWNAPYSAALVSVSKGKMILVWPSRQDLKVQAQSIESEELKAVLCARLLEDRGDTVLVAVSTKGQIEQIAVSKEVLEHHLKSAE